jgi:hypothetical protein
MQAMHLLDHVTARVVRVGSSNEISVEVRDDAGESVSISIPETEIIRV